MAEENGRRNVYAGEGVEQNRLLEQETDAIQMDKDREMDAHTIEDLIASEKEDGSSIKEEDKKQAYNAYVKRIAPKKSLPLQMMKAFLCGGIICCIGQLIINTAQNMGMNQELANAYCSLILVALSVLLTGLSLYQVIANWGGAGALVPIMGFANSVSAPAIEYKPEGQVYGIGVKIFTIAGPVILYGIFTSFCLGLIYYFTGFQGLL